MFNPPRSLLENIEGDLWREVDSINESLRMKLFFDTRKLSQKDIVKSIEDGDRQAGTDQHTTSWQGEIMEVDWPTTNLAKIDAITQTVTETKQDGSTKTTTTTTVRPQMGKSPLQGIGQKLGLAKHNAELDAANISKKVDEIEARRQAAVPKVMAGLDAQGADIGELETFVSDLENAGNQ